MAMSEPKSPSTAKRRVKKVVKKKASTGKVKAKPAVSKRTVAPAKPKLSAPVKKAAIAPPVGLEAKERTFRAPKAAGTPAPPATSYRGGAVRGSEVTVFLRQLIMLLEAGTPILKALKTLSTRGRSSNLRALVADIATYVESGNPLWQSFDRHPKYFDSVFVNLVKASEASGTLVVVLRRLVEYRVARELMRKRVIGAMVYPVILIFVCYAVTLLIANFVVPGFKEMFSKSNVEIPNITQNVFWMSDIVIGWWWLPIVAVVALIVAYKFWFVRNPLRRLAADRIKITIPIMGEIVHKQAIVDLTRTMALLLRSGVSMMATLDLVRNAVHNQAVAQSLQGVRDSVERGGGLEPPLREAEPVIPAVVTDMLVTGEESGRVDIVADQVADVYEEEGKIAVATVGESLLPIFAILVGIIVLIIAVALFLPMISMMDQLSGM